MIFAENSLTVDFSTFGISAAAIGTLIAGGLVGGARLLVKYLSEKDERTEKTNAERIKERDAINARMELKDAAADKKNSDMVTMLVGLHRDTTAAMAKMATRSAEVMSKMEHAIDKIADRVEAVERLLPRKPPTS